MEIVSDRFVFQNILISIKNNNLIQMYEDINVPISIQE